MTIVNANLIAETRGMKHHRAQGPREDVYANLIRVHLHTSTGETDVTGTVAHDGPHIVAINDFWVDIPPGEGWLLLCENQDQPGMIGAVGTFLGEHDINISFMRVGRMGVRGQALMAVGLDDPISAGAARRSWRRRRTSSRASRQSTAEPADRPHSRRWDAHPSLVISILDRSSLACRLRARKRCAPAATPRRLIDRRSRAPPPQRRPQPPPRPRQRATPTATPAGRRQRRRPSRPAPAGASITISAVGDISLARQVVDRMEANGAAYPYELIAPLITGDIGFANLEGALTDRGEPWPKGYNFRTPPRFASGLLDAGTSTSSRSPTTTRWTTARSACTTRRRARCRRRRSTPAPALDYATRMGPRRHRSNGLRVAFIACVLTPNEGGGFDDPRLGGGTGTRPASPSATTRPLRAAVARRATARRTS